MVINNNRDVLLELSSYLKGVDGGKQKQVQAEEVKQEPPASKSDRVDISSKSREIQKVRAQVETVPDVREVKVKELKESVDSGTYNVKGEAIADGMIKKSLVDVVL